ncbi:hypothetical protein OOJ91_31430 [Micromonospora lupini]|uniref:hypothetical protein n=1 Tax=Micromonospora lupini TaxID=285679 RepID=UPI00225AD16C|nr:hypothetical protein [Micromonospora lupini]MCX5070362.1 hypothetical protein [Micromonospora lupini]
MDEFWSYRRHHWPERSTSGTGVHEHRGTPDEYDAFEYGAAPVARPDMLVYDVPLLLGEEEGHFGEP